MNPEQIGELLEKRKLWDYIIDSLSRKHVGDIPAKEIILLSAIGRLVENKKPFSFNLILHSVSSAGKDHLVESVLKLFPEEDIQAFGRTSKTFLTYYQEVKSWDGKILYLEEITDDALNNEVMRVMTAGLTRSGITKDQKARVIEVKGKPVVICTTATTKPTPEIMNRFSIVKLDESEEQTKRTFGIEEEEYDPAIKEHLAGLKPQVVNIPITLRNKIAKVFPAHKPRMRRAFPRFLDLVRAIAVFNNAKTEEGTINATLEDYDLAVRVFSNYRSGVSAIPLKKEDKKIIEVLEKSKDPLSAREILAGMEKVLTQSNIYKHLENLKENEILECFDTRDAFNNPVKKYQISEEFKDKNPIQLPDSSEID